MFQFNSCSENFDFSRVSGEIASYFPDLTFWKIYIFHTCTIANQSNSLDNTN